ncbi:MAG: transcription-repair-coupling factor [Planctomycetota bacterium]|nr:MAG: transcription-repair-coupling factor [Planctomycetota bacterium]
MQAWLQRWREDARVAALVRALELAAPAGAPAEGAPVQAGSVWGAAQALLLATVRAALGRPVLAVVAGPEEQQDLLEDLAWFLAPPRAEPELDPPDAAAGQPLPSGRPAAPADLLCFPACEEPAGGACTPDLEAWGARLEVLRALGQRAGAQPGGPHAPGGPPPLVVASLAALAQPVPPPAALAAAELVLEVGCELPLEQLQSRLAAAGFERVPLAEAPGEWSRRGGIVDIVPLGAQPCRIELFGDEIDTIRSYDLESQRSVATHRRVVLPLWAPAAVGAPAAGPASGLLEHLPSRTVVVLLEPDRLRALAATLARGGSAPALSPEGVLAELARRAQLELAGLPFPAGPRVVDFGTRSVERASGTRMEEVVAGVRGLLAAGSRITVVAPRAAERRRLRELLGAIGGELEICAGSLSRGFEDPASGWALLSARELFRRPVARRPRAAGSAAARAATRPLDGLLDLQPGDLVVHLTHGIGRFLGLERIEDRDGKAQDYLKLQYAGDVVVYVPSTRIELVQRYVGTKGFKPRLSQIGTGGWQRKKERVRRAVLDMAAELLEIQARRALAGGMAHPVDPDWQEAFEAAFPFADTPDQAAASAAIRADLASPRPMDRLVCGDVGYGKTELAMRAAFQVAVAGRQVALLVPTTVLAEQHLATFRSRLAAFPVRVACLTRFCTGREERAILEALRQGEIDILIGTHRLLSADVRFRDLGLVIIDEEQRFGVADKERLKRLRATVDVLTLTATPIPRTLHMALLGIKDISALGTPPSGRLPIRTVIAREDAGLVREAILRELGREGQVYYVHNRVQTIARRAEELARLVPEARFAVVHGQMPGEQLEERMSAFVRGEVDVLVTTTIIESGLDIPRANTLIVERADRFGLAELHQLRGRVGRYTHQAWAYLLLPRHLPLREVAARRLKAIEEFNELGAGFRIAMRDLELRGAGNILGTTQSGHIAAVGYELYCRLLEQAVEELKRAGVAGGPAAEGADAQAERAAAAARRRRQRLAEELAAREAEPVEIELVLDAHLPASYIADLRLKLEAYRRLAAARTFEQVRAAAAELRDRYGPLPEPARTLVRVHLLRVACERLGVRRVAAEGKVAVLALRGEDTALRARLERSGARALWPEPGVCYLLVSERPAPPPEQVLAVLLRELGGIGEQQLGCEPAPAGRRARRAAAGSACLAAGPE